MKISATLGALSLLALTACNSTTSPSFVDMADTSESLLERYHPDDQTDCDDMPDSGTATYNGIAGLGQEPNDNQVYAQLQLIADFDDSSIGGKLYNFRNDENERVAGKIDIGDYGSSISGSTFNASLSGTLSYAGDSTYYEGSIDGHFLGSGADAVQGGIYLETGDYEVYGGFIAEK